MHLFVHNNGNVYGKSGLWNNRKWERIVGCVDETIIHKIEEKFAIRFPQEYK